MTAWCSSGSFERVLTELESTGGSEGTWRWLSDYVYRDGQLLAVERWQPAVTTPGEPPARGPAAPATAPRPKLRLHYHLDHLGTPRAITSASGGLVSLANYFPFGEELTAPPPAEKMRFTGHERDALLPGRTDDMDYLHARHALPRLGRFLSTDKADSAAPVAPQSWNRYAYTRGNPLVFVDPDGRASVSYLRKQAVAQAWERERAIVAAGGGGTRAWTSAEISELSSTGRVGGYFGHHINSVAAHPEMAGNPANIEFLTRSEHYSRHYDGRFRLPTQGALVTRVSAFLQVVGLGVDAISQYQEMKTTGISSSWLFGAEIVDTDLAAKALDGADIEVSNESGGILHVRGGAFYRTFCTGGDKTCKIDSAALKKARFSIIEIF